MSAYIDENNYNVDAAKFIKYYAESDPPWYDQKGKPVRSWKQKLIAVWAEKKPKAKKCVQCSKTGVYVNEDDTGQKYWLCEDHKPKHQPLKGVPLPQMKGVPEGIDKNDTRNRNRKALGIA